MTDTTASPPSYGPEYNAGMFLIFLILHSDALWLSIITSPTYSCQFITDSWALLGTIAWELENNRITNVNNDGTFVAPDSS